jgi:MFS family permease
MSGGLSRRGNPALLAGAIVLVLSLADRLDLRRLFLGCAFLASAAVTTRVFVAPADAAALLLRFVAGAAMAGVYPVGMRLAARVCGRDAYGAHPARRPADGRHHRRAAGGNGVAQAGGRLHAASGDRCSAPGPCGGRRRCRRGGR